MEVLNKLKSTVSYAFGNPVTREYDVGKQVASAGPGLLWKIFEATKKSTKEEASIWILEKRLLDSYNKHDREYLVNGFKAGISQLTRIRHPKVLSVAHALEESRESLGFATEPVFASLANLLGYHDNLNESIIAHMKDFELYDTEIKYGVLQLTEGLSFLHNDCKQVHSNLCPESVIVIKSGSWKLAGFDHSKSVNNTVSGSSTANMELVVSVPEWTTTYPPVGQPSLNYLPPEVALQGRATPASDMYSVGMLLYAIHNKGRCLFDSRNDLASYRKNVEELRTLRVSVLQSVPEKLREYVKLMFNYEPTVRPDADQFRRIPFFDDAGVVTLQNLDNLRQLDNLAKSQFYKALPQTVTTLPKRINLHRVYPLLAEEFQNHNMVPFVLPTVLQIADMGNEVEFEKYILPKLAPCFLISEPIQITMIFLQNLNILLAKCPAKEFKNYIQPMINRALEVENNHIQELCLTVLPTIAHMMEFSSLKSVVIPRIKRLAISTSNTKVRVNCLVCIGKLMEHLDKWTVIDDILPIAMDIKTRDPTILMSILGIYRVAFSHKKLGMTKEFISTKGIPYLTPIAIEGNLNLSQFNAFMQLIKEMLAKMESEQRTKLEQLHSIQQEQKTLQYSQESQFIHNGITNGENSQPSMMDSFMSNFNLGTAPPKLALPAPPSSSLSLSSSTPVYTANIVDTADYTADASAAMPQFSRPCLSLEDKQKLAAQQEQIAQYKKQSTLVGGEMRALGAAPPASKSKPKDLTSTLMERNLASMSKPNYNVDTSSLSGGPSWQQQNQMKAQSPSSELGGQLAIGWTGGVGARPQMNTAPLDNLFGVRPAAGQPSLNQMRGATQVRPAGFGFGGAAPPMMMAPRFGAPQQQPPPAANQTAPTSSLSSSDIADLLG